MELLCLDQVGHLLEVLVTIQRWAAVHVDLLIFYDILLVSLDDNLQVSSQQVIRICYNT